MHIEDVSYSFEGATMIGHLAYDDLTTKLRPAVLVSHEGPGLDGHAKAVTEHLAALGYVAFALDYHGGGEVLAMDAVMERLGALRADPARAGALARAGLDVLLAQRITDHHRIAAIGYCYGGVMSLELARTGADVKAVVGFHPGFHPADAAPRTEASRRIKGSVLLCCGADDPFATPDQRAAFEAEIREAGVTDWRMELYGGVGHSFTNPHADLAGMAGIEYNARAERRSWRSMLAVFDETLGPL